MAWKLRGHKREGSTNRPRGCWQDTAKHSGQWRVGIAFYRKANHGFGKGNHTPGLVVDNHPLKRLLYQVSLCDLSHGKYGVGVALSWVFLHC